MGKDWKDEYKEKLSDYQEPAQEGLFDKIMTACDAVEKDNAGRKRIFPVVAGLAAAAAVGLGVFLWHPAEQDFPYGTEAVITGDNSGGTDVNIVDPDNNKWLYGADSGIAEAGIAPADNGGGNGIVPDDTADSGIAEADIAPAKDDGEDNGIAPAADDKGDVIAPDSGAETSGPSEQETDRNDTSVTIRDREYSGWKDDLLLLADAGDRKRHGKPSFGVYAAGLTGGSDSYSGYSPDVSHAMASSVSPLLYGRDALAGILMYNYNREEEVLTENRHYLPIRAGISVSYAFTDRWSIESGIVYSYLLSTFRTGSDSYFIDSRQTLHYLGIPLTASYNIWKNRWLDVYVSAGGMLEKCIGGNVRNNYVYNDSIREKKTDHVTVRPLQWSVSASAGLQFNITRLVGLYLEPGVTYHFDNKSGIANVYNEHPLNFNMNLGLRFSFE